MKILSVIAKLDQSSDVRLRAFLESPYFNKNEKLPILYNLLRKTHLHQNEIDKEAIWSQLTKSKKFNDQYFRKYINQLLTQIETFFAVEGLMNKKDLQLRLISEYAVNKRINVLKNTLVKRNNTFCTKSEIHSSESFYDLYTSRRFVIDIESDFEKKKSFQSRKELTSELGELNTLLDISYLLEKLRLEFMIGNQKQLGVNYIEDSAILIDKLINKELLSKSKLLNINYSTYKILTEDESHVSDINLILEYLNILSSVNKKEAILIYDNIHNHLIRKINSGEDLNKIRFDLLKFGLKSGILIHNNTIDPSDFRNIVFTACRVKSYQWALEFVEDYKDQLSGEYRQSAYSFSKARILNNMRNHEGVVEVLRNVEYEDITYNLNSRLLLIAAFFELDEFDTLESTIKAFKVFLRRKRNVSVKRKANFRDFCDVVYNLMKAGERKDASRISKANEIMAANKGIPSSWWLKEKIVEVSDVLGYKSEKATSEAPSS